MGSSQNSTDKFLDEVCVHVNSHYDHATIKKELADHIEDMIEVYGEEEVLQHIGDPQDIGEDFNNIYNPNEAFLYRFTKRILTILLLLFIVVNIPKVQVIFESKPAVLYVNKSESSFGDIKSNIIGQNGNKYVWKSIKLINDELLLEIGVIQNEFSEMPQPVFSNLKINGNAIEESSNSYIYNYDGYDTVTFKIDIDFSSIESIAIDINGETLRTYLKKGV